MDLVHQRSAIIIIVKGDGHDSEADIKLTNTGHISYLACAQSKQTNKHSNESNAVKIRRSL